MPCVRYILNQKEPPVTVRLYKRITSIGSDKNNDICLPAGDILPTHAHIYFDGSHYWAFSLDRNRLLHVNTKKVHNHRLEHLDQIQLGRIQMDFFLHDEIENQPVQWEVTQLHAYKKMLEFSRKVANQVSISDLLNTLLDAVIDLTEAEKGMVLLLDQEQPRVEAARNMQKETIQNALDKVSDSIITQVQQSKQPVIVSDALSDDQFKTSSSVINLKLCSVMAVPLLDKGDIFAILYLGNDNVVNLFNQESLDLLCVFASQATLLLQKALLLQKLQTDNHNLENRIKHLHYGDIIGSCAAMKSVFRSIDKIAPTNVSVLISGETGTGKELIAKRIHDLSPRASGPFVTINCGAIPENLLESELFGHIRGAFTGAVATRDGKFKAADGGTLFLDEIGELPLQLQVKLLRVLQEKTITKIGDTKPEWIDTRILSATNRDLEKAIELGRFREDLYYRINVVKLPLPALRDRNEDLFAIAKYLLHKYTKEYNKNIKGFSKRALAAIRKEKWPGNIRQLENHIKKAVILCDHAWIEPQDLDLDEHDIEPIMPLAEAKERFQRRYIDEILTRNNGNRTKTAKDLCVDPRTIFRHLEKSGNQEDPEEIRGGSP